MKNQTILPVTSQTIQSNGITIPNKRALMVDDKCVNIVSGAYEIHQPMAIYEQFQTVAQETGLQINGHLYNKNNGGLLISAKYQTAKIIGDSHDINLTFYTSHCGKYKTFLTMDLLRMACMNQVPALYGNKKRHLFAEKHYKNALDITLMGDLIAGIPQALANHIELMELLQSKSFTIDNFVEFAADHWNLKKEQKQFDSKVANLKAVYLNAQGQSTLGNNAYKAFNAITYINTHNGKNTAMKDENVMTKNSDNTLKAMTELLAA